MVAPVRLESDLSPALEPAGYPSLGPVLDSGPPSRGFLQALVLSGETQERERILYQFSKRFHYCNPGAFPSAGREGAGSEGRAHWAALGDGKEVSPGSAQALTGHQLMGVCLGSHGDPKAFAVTRHSLGSGKAGVLVLRSFLSTRLLLGQIPFTL